MFSIVKRIFFVFCLFSYLSASKIEFVGNVAKFTASEQVQKLRLKQEAFQKAGFEDIDFYFEVIGWVLDTAENCQKCSELMLTKGVLNKESAVFNANGPNRLNPVALLFEGADSLSDPHYPDLQNISKLRNKLAMMQFSSRNLFNASPVLGKLDDILVQFKKKTEKIFEQGSLFDVFRPGKLIGKVSSELAKESLRCIKEDLLPGMKDVLKNGKYSNKLSSSAKEKLEKTLKSESMKAASSSARSGDGSVSGESGVSVDDPGKPEGHVDQPKDLDQLLEEEVVDDIGEIIEEAVAENKIGENNSPSGGRFGWKSKFFFLAVLAGGGYLAYKTIMKKKEKKKVDNSSALAEEQTEEVEA